jgi:hypothetical protein
MILVFEIINIAGVNWFIAINLRSLGHDEIQE